MQKGHYLNQGMHRKSEEGKSGVIYIDDFEGSKSGIDLRFPPISWALASTPAGATDNSAQPIFPEGAIE